MSLTMEQPVPAFALSTSQIKQYSIIKDLSLPTLLSVLNCIRHPSNYTAEKLNYIISAKLGTEEPEEFELLEGIRQNMCNWAALHGSLENLMFFIQYGFPHDITVIRCASFNGHTHIL